MISLGIPGNPPAARPGPALHPPEGGAGEAKIAEGSTAAEEISDASSSSCKKSELPGSSKRAASKGNTNIEVDPEYKEKPQGSKVYRITKQINPGTKKRYPISFNSQMRFVGEERERPARNATAGKGTGFYTDFGEAEIDGVSLSGSSGEDSFSKQQQESEQRKKKRQKSLDSMKKELQQGKPPKGQRPAKAQVTAEEAAERSEIFTETNDRLRREGYSGHPASTPQSKIAEVRKSVIKERAEKKLQSQLKKLATHNKPGEKESGPESGTGRRSLRRRQGK